MDIFGSSSRSRSFKITHSGKFKDKHRQRISLTDEIWIGPAEIETFKNNKVSGWFSERRKHLQSNLLKLFPWHSIWKAPSETQKSVSQTQTYEHNGFSSSVASSDKKLSSDISVLEASSNQNKGDYKSAETATWSSKFNLATLSGWLVERVDISNP